MFYTKYRPQKFSEISQPNDVAHALMNQVKAGKIGHAYLFVGPRGTGKTTTARILAKALNCKKIKENGDPCDKCDSCKAIKEGKFIDLIEIDAASNRGIDDIRELRDKIKLSPSQGLRKVYIIDEVHMLTNEAFNALLKTLEEPPKHVNFILCTTELHKVPETVKSRCQVFKFKRATVPQLVEKLELIAKQEKVKVSKDDLKKIAKASLGGFRDAETLFQQVVEGSLEVDTLLNAGTVEAYIGFIELLNDGDANGALKIVNKVYEDGIDLYVWTGELIKYLRDLLFISAKADEGLVDTSEEAYLNMKEQAEKISPGKILKYLESFMKAQNSIKSSFITQLPVELAIVELCGYESDKLNDKTSDAPNAASDSAKKKPVSAKTKIEVIAVEEVRETEKVEITVEKSTEDSDNDEEEEKRAPLVELKEVGDRWKEVVSKTKEINSSLQALVKSGKPVEVAGATLMLEVMYPFHKERLESNKNRRIIEDILKEVVGQKLRIKCRVSNERPKKLAENETGNLTDLNLVKPVVTPENALDLFDGSLPLS